MKESDVQEALKQAAFRKCEEAYMDLGVLNRVADATIAAQIRVTDEMVEAGKAAWIASGGELDTILACYRAMASLAPKDMMDASTQVDNAIAGLMIDLAAMRIAAEDVGNHPYHGPLSKPDENGKRVPVCDPVHEKFHGSIGDVLSGKVMPEARRQMEDALRRSPPEPKTFPVGLKVGDPRRLGG